mgnify:CR=1 FL=1
MDKNDKIREGPVQINDLNNYKPEVNSPVPNVQCFPSNNMGSIWNLFHVALFTRWSNFLAYSERGTEEFVSSFSLDLASVSLENSLSRKLS